ncbi:MAG: polyhydroxyalkanoate depolymerase [Novosphingobium sp.]|nr:polyhydroxyalkanoate depolymerase [Novosphingobium sp.]MCP5404167.1 polyhydroxyalkanoate depolymerase [Novosphingobium sp.]
MIYSAYEAVRRSVRPMAKLMDLGHHMARDERNPWRDTFTMRALATACELPARAMKDYGKPRYQVWEHLGDIDVVFSERVVESLPFADLLNFEVPEAEGKPKVLIAAALSGHFATLLQDTIRGFARDFDPYITDWKDAREVPVEEGRFGFDEYVAHLIHFIETLGPGTHLVATCQAAPPAMVAVAVLAERNPELVPASLTLMGGPVDTRVSPIFINKMADKIPLRAFQRNNIHTIPKGYPGSGRKVYPGFFQLSGFIMLNPKPHIKQYFNFVRNSLKGDEEALQKFRDFYDEYFAVLDMAEDFYLDTLQKVFVEHHIPTGQMTFEGKPVDFTAVHDMCLLTVEGENDNFCPPGQTEAAHDVFSGIPSGKRKNYIQEGVGHYGVFSGSKFQKHIYPVIRDFIDDAQTDTIKFPVEAEA